MSEQSNNESRRDHASAAGKDNRTKRRDEMPCLLFCVRCGYPLADTSMPEHCPQCGHRPCPTCGE